MSAPMTCLGGALRRSADDRWTWADGAAAPAVSDLRLSDLAPSFRCVAYGDGGTYVEIPRRWRTAGRWPGGVVDPDAADAIERLLRFARAARIFAEGLAELRNNHRATRDGWLLPVERWDAVMSRACGATWPKTEEPRILARARALGFKS